MLSRNVMHETIARSSVLIFFIDSEHYIHQQQLVNLAQDWNVFVTLDTKPNFLSHQNHHLGRLENSSLRPWRCALMVPLQPW